MSINDFGSHPGFFLHLNHDVKSMHPLGFSYYPDGAHNDKDELEPGITPPDSSSRCTEDLTCPTPKYYLNQEFLGSDSDSENFGLDDYEPKFFHPLTEWIGKSSSDKKH